MNRFVKKFQHKLVIDRASCCVKIRAIRQKMQILFNISRVQVFFPDTLYLSSYHQIRHLTMKLPNNLASPWSIFSILLAANGLLPGGIFGPEVIPLSRRRRSGCRRCSAGRRTSAASAAQRRLIIRRGALGASGGGALTEHDYTLSLPPLAGRWAALGGPGRLWAVGDRAR